MASKFETFVALHVPGDPIILYNAWDAGSARAVAAAGAKAIATGSWGAAMAHGFEDGEALPIELALANAARIVAAVDLPVTIDFEGGYAEDAEGVGANMARLAETGAVGCNFEDRLPGNQGVYPIAVQAARVAAAVKATPPGFFVNARTDLFIQCRSDEHDDALADAAIERGHAFAEAGASGFFVPGVVDMRLLANICAASPLPVNFMGFFRSPSITDATAAGVGRISHGPMGYRLAMKAVEDAARAAFAG
jgi:2-methylisocitrate lyase-like PEP mutase family enzyme